MTSYYPDVVLMHVLIHSHHETGNPDGIEVLDVSGTVNIQWMLEAIQNRANDPDLVRDFHDALGRADDGAWFAVKVCIEDDGSFTTYDAEVLSVVSP